VQCGETATLRPGFPSSRLLKKSMTHKYSGAIPPTQSLCEKSRESPNRQVGVLSLQPTRNKGMLRVIPQPAGWGAFTSAYKKQRHAPRNPPTGSRLGILHSSLTAGTQWIVAKGPSRSDRLT